MKQNLLQQISLKEIVSEHALKRKMGNLNDKIEELENDNKASDQEIEDLRKELQKTKSSKKTLKGLIAVTAIIATLGIGSSAYLFNRAREYPILNQHGNLPKDNVLQTANTGCPPYSDPKAEECYKKAIEHNPKNAEIYFKLGSIYKMQERYAKAEAAYKNGLELNPNDAFYLNELGYLYLTYMDGKNAEAEIIFKRLVKLRPNGEYPHVALGSAYERLKKYQQAEAEYKIAIKLSPTNPSFHEDLGELYKAMERHEESKKEFKIAEDMRKR